MDFFLKKNKEMKFDFCFGEINQEKFDFVEKEINIKFPDIYKSHIKNCDGGYPIKNCFEYHNVDLDKNIEGCLGSFSRFIAGSSKTILDRYNNPPEFFPKGLIAFGEVGCGDLICFDYRKGKDNPDPPIVYWDHEANEGKDVSFIAKNFEEFINMLYEPED